MSASFTQAISAACALQLQVNGNTVRTTNLTMNAARNGGYANFSKGDLTFNQGDMISALINYSTTGVNTSAQVDVVVESNA